MESLSEVFQQIAGQLAQVAERSRPGTALKAIVETYLSPEHRDQADCAYLLAALASELARTDKTMKESDPRAADEIQESNASVYARPPNCGQGTRLFAIFSTMIGAIEIARVLPDPEMRVTVLDSARDFLLHSF